MEMKRPFESIVVEHSATVLRVCRAVVGIVDADDAWSETFIAAMRSYESLPADANVQAWLVTIAHRKAIDITRARQRRENRTQELAEGSSVAQASSSVDHDLWAAVVMLPEKQRQAVAYRYLGGLAYKDIAQLLGGTTQTARRAAADGLRTLRLTFADGGAKGENS